MSATDETIAYNADAKILVFLLVLPVSAVLAAQGRYAALPQVVARGVCGETGIRNHERAEHKVNTFVPSVRDNQVEPGRHVLGRGNRRIEVEHDLRGVREINRRDESRGLERCKERRPITVLTGRDYFFAPGSAKCRDDSWMEAAAGGGFVRWTTMTRNIVTQIAIPNFRMFIFLSGPRSV